MTTPVLELSPEGAQRSFCIPLPASSISQVTVPLRLHLVLGLIILPVVFSPWLLEGGARVTLSLSFWGSLVSSVTIE